MTWLDEDSLSVARAMRQPASEAEYWRRIEETAPVWTRLPGSRRRVMDLSGRRYGLLTVVCPMASHHGDAMWLCECDCGRQTIVLAHNLRSGNTRSCGCQGKGQATRREEVPDGVV